MKSSFDGQLNVVLQPGESKDYVYGQFVPMKTVVPGGVYAFVALLQIFAATVDRPMISESALSGTWQVVKSNKQ